MKTETHYSITEMDELTPFELEIYYFLSIKDIKDKIEAMKNAKR